MGWGEPNTCNIEHRIAAQRALTGVFEPFSFFNLSVIGTDALLSSFVLELFVLLDQATTYVVKPRLQNHFCFFIRTHVNHVIFPNPNFYILFPQNPLFPPFASCSTVSWPGGVHCGVPRPHSNARDLFHLSRGMTRGTRPRPRQIHVLGPWPVGTTLILVHGGMYSYVYAYIWVSLEKGFYQDITLLLTFCPTVFILCR
ncbi:hypothetical protein K435DRAFT_410839 [Dendrothele bispora CBS 962.96]|uniref:Uncharacterized protein n=1 Tax=Dendrothele bispora (strain CBS 962.96) TaxID=1314807 RepID=A0A4S8MF87_DENBC|nr:hypothetical protein K435DRAFT_410839 [Dendrothele bispora CBS 962.96]